MADHGLNFGINEVVDGLVQMVAQEVDDEIVDAADLLGKWRVLGQVLAGDVDDGLNSGEQTVLELMLGISDNKAL